MNLCSAVGYAIGCNASVPVRKQLRIALRHQQEAGINLASIHFSIEGSKIPNDVACNGFPVRQLSISI